MVMFCVITLALFFLDVNGMDGEYFLKAKQLSVHIANISFFNCK